MKPQRPRPLLTGALLAIACTFVLVLALRGQSEAQEVHRNFVGSVQLDYLYLPGEKRVNEHSFDSATVELSLKLAVDFSEEVSANVKVCFSCHGFELGMAHFDMRVADQLNFRVGRFIPAFGEFPLRHDPANHRTSDKPLPYDMGRMVHLREWNMSVLPAPWVDSGVEVNGTQFFGDSAQLDYAAYAVAGPSGGDDAVDFDYIDHRTLYYVDNNSQPTVGGRVAGIVWLPGEIPLSMGASGMYGTFDPSNRLSFLIAGADLGVRTPYLTLRGEYLWRRNEMFLGANPEQRFRYGPKDDGSFDDFQVKEGFYLEAEVPVERFDFVVRWDGMRRRGNVLRSSELSDDSSILRYTGAGAFRLSRSLRLKLSYEYYDFSDFHNVHAIHSGLAGAF
ncbi:hypothetical protein [Haliangium ochraceum]|uniref:Uncharacterized protein n=1 Tax=Haliangium ochraceum (strain DSM 14365 / JCM 11303 / SMP-2) TaxID=502025 RepID=D0LVH1_HALO1|nr:hypothetical protein [Haliangium ochraceum]ACY17532.1 conserved hypothetical protein [Haliangium ochraceum DSM 14365]